MRFRAVPPGETGCLLLPLARGFVFSHIPVKERQYDKYGKRQQTRFQQHTILTMLLLLLSGTSGWLDFILQTLAWRQSVPLHKCYVT